MEELKKNNIILIGFMGSGKTTVGRLLSDRMKYSFLDTDSLIEQQEQLTVRGLFETKGEEYFRKKETLLLEELMTSQESIILSTGGGMPLRERNRELLKGLGFVVYLRASDDTTIYRLKNDTSRPLLSEDLELKVKLLQKERTPIYTEASHLVIYTDDKTPETIVQLILDNYKKLIMD